jgi:hypothetical protein
MPGIERGVKPSIAGARTSAALAARGRNKGGRKLGIVIRFRFVE